jgi:adenylate cyclase
LSMILGKPVQEIIGCELNKTLQPISGVISPHLQQVTEQDQSITGLEINPEIPGRGTVDLRINLSPLKDANRETQGIAMVMEDFTEKKRLEAQHRLFERMVSPAVIHTIDPDALQLGGKRTIITTLFADIRGFTGFSEKLPPEELVSILNRYLAAAADAILFEDGTIDKFIGDAVMAWFNAPVPQHDHTLRAVRAALAIRSDFQCLHKDLPEKYHLSFGVGIHVGEAVLGLVGTERRIDYTAIGDSVNTAKRIQEYSAAGQILISHEALDNISDSVIVERMDAIIVKGKINPIQVYQLIRLR